MKIDNSKYEMGSGGGDYLPEGSHLVQITSQEAGENTNRKPYIRFTFERDGQKHIEDFYTTEKAMWRLKWLSVRAGIGENESWEPVELIGKRVVIELKKNEDNAYKKIVDILEPGAEVFDGGDPF
jgi:hypothetical protein